MLGCPQGSLLSPFLWNILMDALLRMQFGQGAAILAYADDVTVAVSDRDSGLASQRLQRAVDSIRAWLRSVKLEINAAKTVLVIFSKRKVSLPALSLRVVSQVILPSSFTRLLGVIID